MPPAEYEAGPPNFCVMEVRLKEEKLPNIENWQEVLKSRTRDSYQLAGVELTIEGIPAKQGDKIVLSVPGIVRPIRLAALKENFRPPTTRPADDAAAAAASLKSPYDNLAADLEAYARKRLLVTGPIEISGDAVTLHVRESRAVEAAASPK